MALVEEYLATPSTPTPLLSLLTHLIPDADDSPSHYIAPPDDAHIIFIPSPSDIHHPTDTNIDITAVSPPVSHFSTTKTPTVIPHTIPDDEENNPTVNSTSTGPPDNFHLSTNPLGPSTTIDITVKGNHSTLSLDLAKHPDSSRLVLRSCIPSTHMACIPRWRSTLRNS